MSDIFTKKLEFIKSPIKSAEMSSPETDTNSQQSQDGIHEVSSARSRFSGALNIAERIVDKYAGDDFPISPFKRFQSLDSPFPSPTKSPRGVRRRRKKAIPLNTAFHHTFVMKLFDRSVDLAQFPVQTPLYPVCRAWMKNDPHNTNMAPRLRTPTPEPEENNQNGDIEEPIDDDDDTSEKNSKTTDPDIYKLPPPEPLQVTDEGLEESVRVPKFEKGALEKDFEVKENTDAPNAETLLNEHRMKWQGIRKSWKQAAVDNEKRYSESMKILTAMYES
jgi:hypothetical protein